MSSENNKRIAKNTMLLYFRMILTMLVALYTSRIVLNTLGVEDFGIYNVVGGFVTMFGFLNSAMASATQRFLAFEIGRNDKVQLRNVFSMSLNIHFIIAFAILILAETIGLWFVNTQLAIPSERMEAARWVFHFSILTLMVSMVNVPYNAMIIAHERMGVFAWVSIAEVSLKLIIVFVLLWLGFDKLKLYGILMFSVSFVIFLIYSFYCNKTFREYKYELIWVPVLFKQIFSHSGWMLFGTTTNMLSLHGVNLLMNIFFGVMVNASRGIAYQIQGVVNSFVNNYMVAVQPQIIKYFAQNKFEQMYRLVFISSKFSFFLVFILSLPVLLFTEIIIHWWLKIVPEQVVIYTRLTIIDLFVITQFPSIASVSQATGKIKYYQLTIAVGFLLVFIITYLLFKMGFPSHYAFIVMIFMSLVGLVARLIVLKIQISFPLKRYLKNVLVRIILVMLIAIPLPWLAQNYISTNIIMQFFIVIIISIISSSIAIWFVGLEKSERNYLYEIIIKKIVK